MNTHEQTPLALDPIFVPGLITSVQTEGADGGVNYNMLHSHESGLLIYIQAYLNMSDGDWIDVFWGDDTSPVASDRVMPEHVGEDFAMLVRADQVPEGLHRLYCRVTRGSGGNDDESEPLAVLVRTLFPGGTDPAPDEPGHQHLLPPQPETDFIDEETAKNGVKVTIPGYPNMRRFDRVTLSWGGQLLVHEVTQDEVDAATLDILVGEETILAAGDSNDLILVYRAVDEVHNASSDWSMRSYVTVEIGKGLFDAPMIQNPDPEADPYDVIDLELLGDDDLLVNVLVPEGGALMIGDEVAPTWVGTTAQGQPITFEPEPESVPRIPTVLTFLIPNADVRQLGRGRGVASYAVSRDGVPAGVSKRSFATFLGEEQRLPKPTVSDAVDGVLDPSLAETLAIVPGAALEAGDTVILTWRGIRANGTPLVRTTRRPVSGGGAGQPMSFHIPGDELIAPLDGGTLSVYYTLLKQSGLELESEHETLTVGEARGELPPPFVRPPAQDGVIDPDKLPAYLELVVPPWPGMQAGQTLHIIWRASSGPHFDDSLPIGQPMEGYEVVFTLDRAHVQANFGADIELSYRVETQGEPGQVSEVAGFIIDRQQEIDTGPLRIMGARSAYNLWRGGTGPSLLKALHETTLAPMVAGWRYEDDQRWTAASEWVDEKPGLKLYVRSSSETWEYRARNIIGNGLSIGPSYVAAFVAMRDEVVVDGEVVVDMVAWGDATCGGTLEPAQIELENVVEICASGQAFAARLRNGDVACWGNPNYGGTPTMHYGDFVQIMATHSAFVGRKKNGDLVVWGTSAVAPIPPEVLQYKDYIDLRSATSAFAALRESGHVVVWGHPDYGGELRQGQERFDDIVDVLGNTGGFIALRDFGTGRSVIGWGIDGLGCRVPEHIAVLSNVRRLCATTGGTFCILLETGEVKAWPPNQLGGDIPEEIARLTNVVEVSATSGAYCARLATGQVVAWGQIGAGGDLTDEVARKSNIVQVTGNYQAFAALCSDGTVVAWGRPEYGGDTSAVANRLTDVRAIYATTGAFAALTEDGRVVTWGSPLNGGNSGNVQPDLTGHVTPRRLLSPDEARALSALPAPTRRTLTGARP